MGPQRQHYAYPHKHRLKGLRENNTSDSDFDLKSVFAFTQQHQKKHYTLLMAGTTYYSSDQLAGDRQPSEDLELAVISSATDIETKENGDPSSELKSFSFFARFGRW